MGLALMLRLTEAVNWLRSKQNLEALVTKVGAVGKIMVLRVGTRSAPHFGSLA